MLSNPSNVAAFSVSVPSTLTKTFAWRRSDVMSTPVTVTSPVIRGSFAPPPSARKVATTARIASETRSARRVLRRCGRRERARYLFRPVALDHVADFDILEILDPDAALEARAHLAYVVLEVAQRANDAVVHLDPVANDPDAALPVDDP